MPVAVVGMHRSGTSMVAALLHHAGLYLGPEDELMPATPDNQDGFWENMRFVELNDEILSTLGGGWDEPPAPFVMDGPGLTAARLKAEALGHEFDLHRPWGWKDPRTTVLLPFWLDAFPDVRLVGCVRNPLEVALSLHRRNYFSYERGLTLWLDYNARLLKTAPPERLLLTHYEAYFADPPAELRRVLAYCGMEASDAKVEEASAAVRDVLRHNRFDIADLIAADVSPEVIGLYARLCEESCWPGQNAVTQLSAAERGRGGERGPRGRLNRAVVDAAVLRGEVERLQQGAGTRESALEQLQQRVADLEGELAAATHRNDALAAEATGQEASIGELRRELDDLRANLTDREQRIEQLAMALAAAETVAEQTARRLRADVEDLRAALRERVESADGAAAALALREAAIEELRVRVASLEEQLAPATPDAEPSGHPHLRERIRAAIADAIPLDAIVLVVSKGDEALLELAGRQAWHFPRTADGSYPWHHPADSRTAIAQLEALKAQGAGFLLFPAPAFWWLDHYRELTAHLEASYRRVWVDESCVVYDLEGQSSVDNGAAPLQAP